MRPSWKGHPKAWNPNIVRTRIEKSFFQKKPCTETFMMHPYIF